MAGVKDIWKKSKGHTGLDIINVDQNKKKEFEQKLKLMYSNKQMLDDKKLEFFIYENGIKTGLERVFRGLAKKLYHGAGPIMMKFNDIDDLNDKDRKNRIYLNVDGEFFNLVKPLSIKIQLDKSLCNGQIMFLINKNNNSNSSE